MLPTLKLNRSFVKDLMAAQPPCFAMGIVEERMSHCAFLALRVPDEIPPAVTAQGFSFGHAVLGTDDFEVLHFGFHFYGFRTYHTLVNPSVPLAKSVLAMMLETGEYFFFALGPSGAVTAFKAEVGESTPQGIRDHLERIDASITSDIQYQKAVDEFSRNPVPPGPMLTWVCRDNMEYLDLSHSVIELHPA